MARTHGIAIVVLIVAGTSAWFLASAGDPLAPPLPATTPNDAAPLPSNPLPAGGRTTVGDPTAGPVAGSRPGEGGDRPDAGGEPPAPAATPPNVQLAVLDLAERAPIARFRWTFAAEGAAPIRGDATDGSAAVALPPGAAGSLLVEADGFAAATRTLTVPAAGAPLLPLEFRLERSLAAAGVTVSAHAPDGTPVARLRIDLWQLPADAPPLPAGADPQHEPLWKRGGQGENGVFALPSLAPGRYALRAQPVDGSDAALPLQPWRREFAFAGHEAVPLAAAFSPGVVLAIAADDAVAELQLTALVQTATGPWPVQWRSQRPSGSIAIGTDVLVLPGRATTLLALPPADYRIELRQGDAVVPLIAEPTSDRDRRCFRAVLPR